MLKHYYRALTPAQRKIFATAAGTTPAYIERLLRYPTAQESDRCPEPRVSLIERLCSASAAPGLTPARLSFESVFSYFFPAYSGRLIVLDDSDRVA